MLCGSSVAGLLRTRAQHTVEWHMTPRCGLLRARHHPRLPKRRGQAPPDACFLAVGITPLAAAVHLIAWRMPCAPGRITLIGRYAWRDASMSLRISPQSTLYTRANTWPGRAQARHVVGSQGVGGGTTAADAGGSRLGWQWSRGGHVWERWELRVKVCRAPSCTEVSNFPKRSHHRNNLRFEISAVDIPI